MALLNSASHAQVLESGVAVSNLSGATNSEQFFQIEVPADMGFLTIQTSGGEGDVDLYVRLDAQPSLDDWDYRPYVLGNRESVAIPSPAQGTWYIMLHGYEAYEGVTLVATLLPNSALSRLENGVPQGNLALDEGESLYFYLDVPRGRDFLEVSTFGGSGDIDLYIQRAVIPTLSSYETGSASDGNDEFVSIPEPLAERWFFELYAYAAFTDVTVLAEYSPDLDVVPLDRGVPVNSLSGDEGSGQYFSFRVPEGSHALTVATTGGDGDVDLYVRKGAIPHTSTWDFRGLVEGNEEEVTLTGGVAGDWQIMLHGYTAYSGVTLEATFSPELVIEPIQPGVPVEGLEGEALDARYFSFRIPEGSDSLTVSLSGGSGDADLFIMRGEFPLLRGHHHNSETPGNEEVIPWMAM